ncbi:MAG: SMP-30/gluconolactonase/LRE family protein [Galbitalea sp.]
MSASLWDAGSIERLGTGATWSEGPVWLPARQSVIWSDIPGNRILEYSTVTRTTSVYRDGVEFTNGRTLAHDGSILQCSHGRRRIERDVDGEISVVVDGFDGRRLNSPNDIVVASDGAIWFSDPPYGITVPEEGHAGEREYGDCFVFRLDPATGELRPGVVDVEEPNGLAFSPDETVLYVTDTSAASRGYAAGNHHIRAYDVVGGRCKNGRVFAVMDDGLADGIRVDTSGNVWSSSASGLVVFDRDGELIARIPVPETVANLCFGGSDGTDIYIAATTSLYRIQSRVRDAAQARLMEVGR